MPIKDRNLKVGTVLKARYKGKEYECHVTDRGEGKVGYTLMNKGTPKEEFKSPSQAGSAVMGGIACNGWRFWSLDGAEATKAPSKTKVGVEAKTENKAEPDGETKAKPERSVACGECGKTYSRSRDTAAHMRKEHNSPEAAGNGGR